MLGQLLQRARATSVCPWQEVMEGEEATLDGGDGMKEVILTVEGMMCQKSCGSTVEAALRGVPGVVSAKASFENSNAIVVGTASAEELIDAIESVGFEACLQGNANISEDGSKVKEIVLTVEGMMCQKSCGSTVEAALRGVPGVVSAKASFENSNAIVVGTASAEELIDAIESVGFEACLQGNANISEDGSKVKEIVLTVEGMMCQKSCGSTVEAALRGVPGVVSAKASFENSNAIVVGTASAEELIDAIESVGFEASRAAPSSNVSSVKRKVSNTAA